MLISIPSERRRAPSETEQACLAQAGRTDEEEREAARRRLLEQAQTWRER
jgi:hypothetical protein